MKKIDLDKIFNSNVEFCYGAHNYSQVKDSNLPEIAFIGASNVGKSSLVNGLFNKKIAIVSSTPGRTRQLNFFKILEGFKTGFTVVDMPGYGFAKAKDRHIEHWQKTSLEYLMKRPNLQRLYLLIDPIKGVKKADEDMINMLNATGVSFQIVLTKTDKLKKEVVEKVVSNILERAKMWPACYPEILQVSSLKNYGMRDLKTSIVSVLESL
ncbi:MAG: YihA family ribosome biogenesis GTP-binding protein [Rickettsiales bacterium]|nr:YihA family ribosome biogenesis GTP-binding protein [Rickettsiales bacterium]